MSEIKVKTIEPSTGTNLTLGTSGDTVAVSSDAVKLDIWKDSGGNTLFQSNGSGTLSNVNAAIAGAGPKLILSQTADGSTSISFTSDIDSTYDEYMFVFVNVNPATNNVDFTFQVSIDGGSNYNRTMTTSYFHAYNNEADTQTSLDYQAANDQAAGSSYQILCDGQDSTADLNSGGVLHLYNPSNTTYVKNFYSRTNSNHINDYCYDAFIAGYINETSAINSISFKMSSGNFDGIIKMYGVA